MNIEEKVKMNLLIRGFDNNTQLNNRGLIGATIDETILEVVKNLHISDVKSSKLNKDEIDNLVIETRVKNLTIVF
jgi:citrate lyase gamma subunit